MRGRDLKDKLQAGGIVYGAMISIGRSPRWASAYAEFGLDYLIFDTEHSPLDRGEVGDIMTAMSHSGVVPIVRVVVPLSHYITQALDAGAQGVLAPYCETVEEVVEVVGATKWRPLKGKVLDNAMATGEFPSEDTRRYLEERNADSVCIVGIESVPAIENLDAMLEVPGIDGIFVGPNDLSITLGVPDMYDHPKYEEALRTIIAKCRARNIPVLIHHQTVDLSIKWLREGARFVLFSTDSRQMHFGMTHEFGLIKEVGAELGGEAVEDIGESREVI